jgi:type II secretory pathway component PulF
VSYALTIIGLFVVHFLPQWAWLYLLLAIVVLVATRKNANRTKR